MKIRKIGWLLLIAALVLMNATGCKDSDDLANEARYYQKLLRADDSVICIKALNSASVVHLDTGAENIIRGAKNLSYNDAIYCEYDGKLYFSNENELYSFNADGSGLKRILSEGTKESREVSIKASYGSEVLLSLIYKSETLGIYNGEYIVYDAADGITRSINENSAKNALSYLIASSDDGKVYMASYSGTYYRLVCVDLVNDEVSDLGKIDTSSAPGDHPEWEGCIAGGVLYFADHGCVTKIIYTANPDAKEPIGMIPVDEILSDVDAKFADRTFIADMSSHNDEVCFLLNECKDREYEAAMYVWSPANGELTLADDCGHKTWIRNMLIAGEHYYLYSNEELVEGIFE